jgi:hypothetical protein
MDTDVLRMNGTDIQTLLYEYISTGRRNVGQPNEKWGRLMKMSKAENGAHPVTDNDEKFSNVFTLRPKGPT